MHAVEFQVCGNGVTELVNELARPMQETLWRKIRNACQNDPRNHIIRIHPDVFLVARELLFWRSRGPVMVTITLNFISSDECSVFLVSGGGEELIWAAQESAAKEMIKGIQRICHTHSWTFTEPCPINLGEADV